jgi:hypothetical protein
MQADPPISPEGTFIEYCVEILRFWQECKIFSLYEKFYPFRYEGTYKTPDLSAAGMTFAYTRELPHAFGKYALQLNFGFH